MAGSLPRGDFDPLSDDDDLLDDLLESEELSAFFFFFLVLFFSFFFFLPPFRYSCNSFIIRTSCSMAKPVAS